VAAVIGTHTHVPTADARLLANGTAYCTDAGMTGVRDGVIGFEVAAAQRIFLTQTPTRLTINDSARALVLNSVFVEIDDATGRAVAIRRVDREHTRGG
jgi:calcineurin-like phosphoesterase